jgi:hypothetical protein
VWASELIFVELLKRIFIIITSSLSRSVTLTYRAKPNSRGSLWRAVSRFRASKLASLDAVRARYEQGGA